MGNERLWAGEFGDVYLERNQVDWQKRIPFFKLVHNYTKPDSLFELGCSAGWNLRAFRAIDPSMTLEGIDLNEKAIAQATAELPSAYVRVGTMVPGCTPVATYDVVLTCGVLIHLLPDECQDIMAQLAKMANKFVVAIEYGALEETEVEYRGESGALWRRPFGMMYRELGLQTVWGQPLGPDDGFGEGCTAWVMKK